MIREAAHYCSDVTQTNTQIHLTGQRKPTLYVCVMSEFENDMLFVHSPCVYIYPCVFESVWTTECVSSSRLDEELKGATWMIFHSWSQTDEAFVARLWQGLAAVGSGRSLCVTDTSVIHRSTTAGVWSHCSVHRTLKKDAPVVKVLSFCRPGNCCRAFLQIVCQASRRQVWEQTPERRVKMWTNENDRWQWSYIFVFAYLLHKWIKHEVFIPREGVQVSRGLIH